MFTTTWATNPILRAPQRRPAPAATAAAAAATPHARDSGTSSLWEKRRGGERDHNHGEHGDDDFEGARRGFREPSARLTGMQLLRLVTDGIGGMLIGAGIRFGIAYGLYANATTLPYTFRFPNTLAGDVAVDVFVNSLITWAISTLLVALDLRAGKLQPIGFLREPRSWALRWFWMLDRRGDRFAAGTFPHWLLFLWSQVLRSLLFGVATFLIVWPICVGILAGLGTKDGGDWYFDRKWTPQIFKTVFGGVLGLLITPMIDLFWMARVGWHLNAKPSTPATEISETGAVV